MRNKVTNNGVDLILELLRQTRLIGAKTGKTDNNTLQPDITEINHNPRSSLKGSDMDGKLMLSIMDDGINQRKKDEYFMTIRKYIEDILNSMTEQDYKMLYDQGFKAEDLSIESLASALRLIKDSGKSKAGNKDSEKNSTGNISDDEISGSMKYYNLPVTKESLDKVKGALKLSEEIPYIEKNNILYLLKKDMPPTIENLYKARYSRQNNKTIKKLSDADWNELVPQVKDIINKTGLSPDTGMLEDARWLIENDLPLTKRNLGILSGIGDLAKTYDKSNVMDKILLGMRDGTDPEDVILLDEEDLPAGEVDYNVSSDSDWQKAGRLMENIHEDYDDEIIRAVKSGQEITLENLENLRARDSEYEKLSADDLTKDQKARVVAAKRQLEEIRLKMTYEAALRLERKGFSIDTRPLQEVVEKLRSEEESYYRELYNMTGISPDEEQIDILRTTTQSMQELKTMPAYILGTTLYDKGQQTVSNLIVAGKNMLAELEIAKEAYEPLLTQPRSDYGDSIQKAFNNMNSLMEEMGIEDTAYNRRAIRILGYNRMEITKESIEQVKAYDLKVNYLIQNLNPGTAVRMIKDGINPIDVPIDDLNKLIEKMNTEEGYSSLEKYSTYLYKLEKDSKISESERKAYIGIYRLLYRIEKSDGAALGAVIKSGREVTLNHLLTALRTIQKGGADYIIDDDFGLLQDISYEKESITDQLSAAFNGSPDKNSLNQDNITQGNLQENIQNSVIKQLLDSLTPDKLSKLHQKIKESSPFLTGEQVWDAIGNLSVEKLYDEINNMQSDAEKDQGYYYEKLQELREIYQNCDQAVRFLNDFQLPCTTTNLIMAEYILSNKGTLFMNLKKELKKTEDLTDKLVDRKTMNEAYDDIENEVNEIIDDESKKENIDSFRLNQLRGLGLQMQFIKTLAKREFYHIPVEVSGNITNINLTIIRGSSDRGKVTVSLTSDKLGSIKAEAALKDNKLSGYFLCDHADSLKVLQSKTEILNSMLQGEQLEVKQLNFCLQQPPEAFYGYKNTRDSADNESQETERILYRAAKAILHMVKSAEETDIISHKEVAEIK